MDREGFLDWNTVRYISFPYITDTVLLSSPCHSLSSSLLPPLVASPCSSVYLSSLPLLQNCNCYALGNDDIYLILTSTHHCMIVCIEVFSEEEKGFVLWMLTPCGTHVTCIYIVLQVLYSKLMLLLTFDTLMANFWVWKTLNRPLVWRTVKLPLVWRTLSLTLVWRTINLAWVWRTLNQLLLTLLLAWILPTELLSACLSCSTADVLYCNSLIGFLWLRKVQAFRAFAWIVYILSFVVAYVILVSLKILQLCLVLGSLKPP